MAQGTFVQALRKEAALSGTFMKGRSLMLNGAVLSIEDSGSRFSKNVTVEGSVRGSRGDLYKTHVVLDMDEHEVIDYDCDCPAAYRYPGMCKHAIATALAYLDASGIEPVEGLRTPVRTFTAAPKQAVRPASAAPAVNPNFPFPAPVPTSPSLMKALSDLSDARMDELAGMRRKLAGTVDPDAPKAVLEPSLVPYYNPLFADRFSWALELRIRCGSVSYVVKDIDGMAAAYVRGGTFSYGKKLTFLHAPEAFDEVSVRLLDLVVATVVYLSDITSSRSASYDFARSGFVAERQLPLSEHDIVYMLDLLRGRTISFEPAWSRGTTTHRSYEVAVELSPVGEDGASAKQPPLLAAKIAPAVGGSYDLRLPADMYCFASGDVAYLVDTHRARRADAGVGGHEAAFGGADVRAALEQIRRDARGHVRRRCQFAERPAFENEVFARQVGKRHEDEKPPRHSRVRNKEFGIVAREVVVEEDVEIERSRSVHDTLGPHAPVAVLERLQTMKDFLGFEVRSSL